MRNISGSKEKNRKFVCEKIAERKRYNNFGMVRPQKPTSTTENCPIGSQGCITCSIYRKLWQIRQARQANQILEI